jgi:hypothetical protein
MPSYEIYSMLVLGRTCIHDIPNLWRIHVLHTLPAYMSSCSMPYKPVEYHYTYVPYPIPGNIGIPQRLVQSKCNQIIHHNAMHAHCFVSVSLPERIQPQDLFLRLQPPSLHSLRLQPQWLVFLSMRLQP